MLMLPAIEDGAPLVAKTVRALDEVDLTMSGSVVGASPLKRIRARHHALARALAEGMRPSIAAATYGYAVSRISVLQSDPTFQELIEHYRKEADHDHAQTRSRLTNIGVDALDELVERLENEPEKITVPQLAKLAELAADRTGHGPKTQSDVNVNINLADRLRAARERTMKVIDHEDD